MSLNLAQRAARDIEVSKYLESFFSEPANQSHALAKHARLGTLLMVRHLLDAGADTRRVSGRDGNALVEACQRCHEDVVDVLLEQGADPNFDGDEEEHKGGIRLL